MPFSSRWANLRTSLLVVTLALAGCGKPTVPPSASIDGAIRTGVPAPWKIETLKFRVSPDGEGRASVHFEAVVSPGIDLYAPATDPEVQGPVSALVIMATASLGRYTDEGKRVSAIYGRFGDVPVVELSVKVGEKIPLRGVMAAERYVDDWRFAQPLFNPQLFSRGRPLSDFGQNAFVRGSPEYRKKADEAAAEIEAVMAARKAADEKEKAAEAARRAALVAPVQKGLKYTGTYTIDKDSIPIVLEITASDGAGFQAEVSSPAKTELRRRLDGSIDFAPDSKRAITLKTLRPGPLPSGMRTPALFEDTEGTYILTPVPDGIQLTMANLFKSETILLKKVQ